MSERKKVDGPRRIRQATVELLLESGVRAVTTRMVTDRAGVGRGLLNHYFKWSRLRAEAWAEIFDRILDDPSTREPKPDEFMESYLASAFEENSRAFWRLWLDAADVAKDDPILASEMGRIHQKMLDRIADCLASGAKKGLWHVADPQGTALRLSALYDGLAGMLLTDTTSLTPTEAERHLRQLFLMETG